MPPKVFCSCGCGDLVSEKTQLRHRRSKASPAVRATAAAKGQGPLAPLLSTNLRANPNLNLRPRVNFMPITRAESPAASGPSNIGELDNDAAEDSVMDIDMQDVTTTSEPLDTPVAEFEARDGIDHSAHSLDDTATLLASARASLQERVWAGRTRRSAYVEDAEDDTEEEGEQEGSDEQAMGSESSDSSDEESYEPISSRDVLSEEFLRRVMASGESIGLQLLYVVSECSIMLCRPSKPVRRRSAPYAPVCATIGH